MRQVRILNVHSTCYVRSALSQLLTEDVTMPRVKQAAKHARATKAAAVTAFGTAGLGISLAGASANTIPTAGIPQSGNISPNQRFVLGEEEMADVDLATFHLLDKENAGSNMQLAWVRGCRGCRGCRVGCAGCGGCGVGGCCASLTDRERHRRTVLVTRGAASSRRWAAVK